MLTLEEIEKDYSVQAKAYLKSKRADFIKECKIENCCHKMFTVDTIPFQAEYQAGPWRFDFEKDRPEKFTQEPGGGLIQQFRGHIAKRHCLSDTVENYKFFAHQRGKHAKKEVKDI